ncbi:MAG: right-handed parallel beta-helix repeat-containing protein [Bacteroidota bacterium]
MKKTIDLLFCLWVICFTSTKLAASPESAFGGINPDQRIPIDSLDTDGDGSVDISEPGHYFLRDTLLVVNDQWGGIVINTDNVTIDLNGFAILAGTNAQVDGINVLGNHNNITIENGTIAGFAGAGINGFNTNQSTFRNLIVRNNGFDGLVSNRNCLIVNCTVLSNGFDGLEVDEGSIIRDCTAAFNGDNGIEAGGGSMVYNCISYSNERDGIDVGDGSRVEGCMVYDNAQLGLDVSISVLCLNNTAYRNGWSGIDVRNGGITMNNVSNDNGVCIANGTCGLGMNGQGNDIDQGAGIRGAQNMSLINNQCSGNYFGIVTTSSDNAIVNNNVQNNSHAGIIGVGVVGSVGSLFVGNTAEGNGFAQSPSVSNTDPQWGHPLGEIIFQINVQNNSGVGPIIDVSTSGDISTVMGATHPFANFIY